MALLLDLANGSSPSNHDHPTMMAVCNQLRSRLARSSLKSTLDDFLIALFRAFLPQRPEFNCYARAISPTS